MQLKISKIELGQKEGCQHIHFTLEYPDKTTELVSYHIGDFTSEEITQGKDLVYLQIKQEFKRLGISSKEQAKESLLNLNIEK